MTKPVAREERLQRAVVQHLMMCLPDDVVWFAVPNAGQRNPIAGARMKRQGMRAGIPDLAFVIAGKACFIEMKVEKSHEGERTYLSKEQKIVRDQIRKAGGKFALCRSVDQVAETLTYWGATLKGWSYVKSPETNQRPTYSKVA